MATPGPGRIRALLTIAGNPVSSTPAGHRLDAAMADLDAVVAIDLYLNETTRHADVVLPPTGPLERDHYDLVFHLLAVRDTARFSPALLPKDPGGRHDWEIARDLGLAVLRERAAAPPPAAARPLRTRLDRRTLEAEARLRTSPTRQLDLLLRTGGAGLSVRKLRAAGPGGLDLGPLRPRLPERLLHPRPPRPPRRRRRPRRPAPPPRRPRGQPRSADDELLLIGRRHQRDNNSWLHNQARLTRGRPRHALLVHPDDLAAARHPRRRAGPGALGLR